MINPFRKFAVTFELEQLASLISSAERALAQARSGSEITANKHIDLARESHDDAVTALRYNNIGQAENMLKNGLLHGYFAYRISHSTQAPDVDEPTKQSDAEKAISYLASTLSDLKGSIEYSNCTVSEIARKEIQQAVDLYAEAMSALKSGNELIAKRAAQAGVLQVAFAGALIKADNTLVGQSGLDNPLTNTPIRKMNKLAAAIIQLYQVNPNRSEQIPDLSSKLHKAIQRLDSAIHALSRDNAVYAQALVVQGLDEIEQAHSLIGTDVDDAIAEEERETDQLRQKFGSAHVERLAGEIRNVIQRYQTRPAVKAINRIEELLKSYEAAQRAMDAGDLDQSKSLLSKALRDADQLRQLLFP
jgi:hypothetical protein